MTPLPKPDSYYRDCAEGWLLLGNAKEAELEWNQIDPVYQRRPEVLSLKWNIHVLAKDWDRAAETAAQQCEVDPESPDGIVHLAYSVRRRSGGGIQQAWDILQPAHQRFPKETIIPYNLACYAAQLNRLDEAWEWLQKAVRIAGPSQIRTMALRDDDLIPLHSRLQELS
jgi:hypothetical protein